MPVIDQAAISAALDTWAARIASTAGEQPLGLVGIISHGDVLAQRLIKALESRGCCAQYGAIDITLYRDDLDLRTSRPALRSSHLPFSTDGMHLILVDDVVQSGRTTRAALETIFEYGRPARVELHCLVERGQRELPIQPDYAAFRLPEVQGNVQVHLHELDGEDAVHY
ncbi:MAG: bifunctional pyr operon transcriptional regulator/uracil phosphoribosyltransferase PyrR [Akkermansiaceae bacterium]|nr:bifunctional pyr operon transcriptional regulator/uracil phosphoribosyltransferase PyrR [Akkermansiaceae bacterium]